jgi:group I intron endonuclease
LINGKQYIGSALNLTERLFFYYSFKAMENYLKKYKSHIYNAILKHGHSNFSLTILEYCDKAKCLEREGYYQQTLNPEYNLAKEPGAPMSGRKHLEETKTVMSEAKKGEKNYNFGRTFSDETKQIMSDIAKEINHSGRFKTGENNPNYGQRVEGSGKPSQSIEVTDIKNNITTSYDSISEASKALNIHQTVIGKYFSRNQQKPYKGKYTFHKL